MSLVLQLNNNQLELQDETLTLQLSLHEGLQLLNKIDQAFIDAIDNKSLVSKTVDSLDIKALDSLSVIKFFYNRLFESLMLLSARDRQLLISDASLMALTCLMYIFKGQPAEKVLHENLSQRRISQIQDELSYYELDLNKMLDEFLRPFFNNLNAKLVEKKLTLQDPQGIYFKADIV